MSILYDYNSKPKLIIVRPIENSITYVWSKWHTSNLPLLCQACFKRMNHDHNWRMIQPIGKRTMHVCSEMCQKHLIRELNQEIKVDGQCVSR